MDHDARRVGALGGLAASRPPLPNFRLYRPPQSKPSELAGLALIMALTGWAFPVSGWLVREAIGRARWLPFDDAWLVVGPALTYAGCVLLATVLGLVARWRIRRSGGRLEDESRAAVAVVFGVLQVCVCSALAPPVFAPRHG